MKVHICNCWQPQLFQYSECIDEPEVRKSDFLPWKRPKSVFLVLTKTKADSGDEIVLPPSQLTLWVWEINGLAGVQGWRSGESTLLPPMWPGFDSQTRRRMWVEFVGSLLCTERFSPGTLVSPLLKDWHLTWFTFTVHFSLQCPQLALQR